MDELNLEVIQTRIVSGVAALISRNFVLQLISIAASLLIYYKLKVGDVGIYTIAISAQQIISFFTDFGLGAALVQKKDALREEDITTTFTLQFLITLTIFLIVLLVLSPLATFLKLSSDGEYLLVVLVFTIFVSSFKLIPSILLERNIHFHKLVIPQIAESFTFNVILIVLALQNFGIRSYTWAFLISSLIGIPVYYYVSPWKLRFGIDKKSLHLLKFGTQFQLKNILATIKDNLLTVLLPKLSLSITQIGYIGFAQRIAFIPYRYIVDTTTKVMFSAYSRMQHDESLLRKAIEKSLFFVGFVMFPAMVMLMITGPDFITFIPKYTKYEPAITCLIFFCLNALVSSLSSILINVLDANGKVKVTLQLMTLWTALTWGLTIPLIFLYSFTGVAIASFLVTLTIVVTIWLVRRIVSFSFFGSIYKPACAAMIMGIWMLAMQRVIIINIPTLLLSILLGSIVYLLIIYMIAGKMVISDIKLLLKRG